MKILVTGSGGQLGSELKSLSTEFDQLSFVFTDYPEVDLTRADSLKAAFDLDSFDYCINCAAYTAVDKAEEDRSTAEAINATACQILADLCQQRGITLIHISTDFVFSGEAHRPLKESDTPNPAGFYGLTKLHGEQAIASKLKQHFIFRTSWLYSTYGANFVKTMIRLSEVKDELNIIADQIGTPTYANDLARVILTVIAQKNTSYGLYHFSNEGVASWYDFTCAIFEYKDIKTPVNPIPTEKYPTPAKRPHYSVMDKTLFKETFKIPIDHWRVSLQRCLEKM